MIRRHPVSLIALIAIAAACWQPAPGVAATTLEGSGRVAAEARTVPEFEAVQLAGPFDATVTQGAARSVRVQADDNLLPAIESVIEVHGGRPTLVLRIRRGVSVHMRQPARVAIVVPRLAAVAVASSGSIDVQAFQSASFQAAVDGSGSVRLADLAADELAASIAGSGGITGRGRSSRLTVSIAGSGDVKLAELRADDVKVSISGSGDADVQARRNLAVSIAGSGNVRYAGEARVASAIAGSGKVVHR